jgi:hypothetical protein
MEFIQSCLKETDDLAAVLSTTFGEAIYRGTTDNISAILVRLGEETEATADKKSEPYPTTLTSELVIQGPPYMFESPFWETAFRFDLKRGGWNDQQIEEFVRKHKPYIPPKPMPRL